MPEMTVTEGDVTKLTCTLTVEAHRKSDCGGTVVAPQT